MIRLTPLENTVAVQELLQSTILKEKEAWKKDTSLNLLKM